MSISKFGTSKNGRFRALDLGLSIRHLDTENSKLDRRLTSTNCICKRFSEIDQTKICIFLVGISKGSSKGGCYGKDFSAFFMIPC